jgi:glutaryl-CoA dehydrogenase
MLVGITGAQMMCWRMARLEQEGKVTAAISSAAKVHAAATARRVVLEARAILGGDGILLDKHIARHHGDIEAVYTYEGTPRDEHPDRRPRDHRAPRLRR